MSPNEMSDSKGRQLLYFNTQEVKTFKFAGIVENDVRCALATLQDWVRQQPHLPDCSDSDKEMIWRVWIMRKLSLERTKQTVDMYYSVRNLIPEFFRNRDPVILQEQQVFERVQTIPTPVLLEDYTQLLITRIFNTEEGNFDMNQFVKVLMMVSDLLLRSSCSLGIHLVMDFKNVTMGVIRQVTPSVLKKLQVVITKAYPVRLRSLHLVNTPVYVDKLVTVLKMVLLPKLFKRLIVHPLGLGSLHDHIHPKYLPLEYGGELGPSQDIWDSWTKDLISKRDWFLEQENISSDEKKRPGKPLDQSELFGMEGSFKKLSVD